MPEPLAKRRAIDDIAPGPFGLQNQENFIPTNMNMSSSGPSHQVLRVKLVRPTEELPGMSAQDQHLITSSERPVSQMETEQETALPHGQVGIGLSDPLIPVTVHQSHGILNLGEEMHNETTHSAESPAAQGSNRSQTPRVHPEHLKDGFHTLSLFRTQGWWIYARRVHIPLHEESDAEIRKAKFRSYNTLHDLMSTRILPSPPMESESISGFQELEMEGLPRPVSEELRNAASASTTEIQEIAPSASPRQAPIRFIEVSGYTIIPRYQIDSLPTRSFEDSDVGNSCCICIKHYIKGDQLCKLPCYHEFHPDCISRWLKEKHNCPVCRRPLLALFR